MISSAEFSFVVDNNWLLLLCVFCNACAFGSYFIVGSLPSVIPFACTSDPRAGVIAAAVLCCIACFAVGAIKTITTKGNLWTSGIENVFFAGAGAGLSYGIGALYEHYRSKV